MTQLTREELIAKIITQSEEIDRLEELAIYRAPHQRERDEAREGWAYARLTSEQWRAAYNELLLKSTTRIDNAINTTEDVPEWETINETLKRLDTLEETVANSTPIFCDHSRWREAERTLEAIKALPILNYTAVYDLAADLKELLFPNGATQ
jgi:hypothetical protein